MKKEIQFIIILSVLLLSACVRVDVFDTDHPEHGTITLTTDWSQIGQNITIPQTYIAQIGDYSASLTGTTNAIDNLFLPGTYNAHIYNVADKITVSETTAAVTVSNNIADPMPDWFFTSILNLTIEQDKDHHFTAVMQQQVRELNFVIEIIGGAPDRIESITATLSGVASSLDFANDTYSAAVSVAPVFTKQTDGRWLAAVRLLGIVGNEQQLSVSLTFADNSPAPLTKTIDIHTELSNFNANKISPLTLGAQIIETPNGIALTASIAGWLPGNGSGETGVAE